MIKRTLNQAYETSSWERVSYEPDEELAALNAKIEADPENAGLWMEKGLVLAKNSLYREAGECYARANRHRAVQRHPVPPLGAPHAVAVAL